MSEQHAILQIPAVRSAMTELDDLGAAARLLDRDVTLWGADEDVHRVAGDRLGWLDVTARAEEQAEELGHFIAGLDAAGIDRVVLAGMGGSSLAPETFARTFAGAVEGRELVVLDSTHPVVVKGALDLDLSSTVILVSSKSGGTEETRSFADYAAARAPSAGHLVAITDEGSQVAEQAHADGWLATFTNPSDIGGRYSALSWFGMVPAALVGIDVRRAWASAEAMLDAIGEGAEDKQGAGRTAGFNPAHVLAGYIGGLARAGRDKLTILTAPGLESFGDWAEQLVAESLGKSGIGVVPVVGEPVGRPESYRDDRAFVELRYPGRRAEGAAVLEDAGQPVYSLELHDPYALGGQFVLWEAAVALVGALLEVNPFDEPNVSESKANTLAVLQRVAGSGTLPEPEDGDVAALLAGVVAGDYVSVQCYLPGTPEVHAELRRLQGLLRDRLGVAVTAGVGPRFLHSTGQLHKGGPPSIVALQIVDAALWAEGAPVLAIPGRHHDFGTLIRAQAVGDLQSLRDHERRVAQVGVDRLPGLTALIDRIAADADAGRRGP